MDEYYVEFMRSKANIVPIEKPFQMSEEVVMVVYGKMAGDHVEPTGDDAVSRHIYQFKGTYAEPIEDFIKGLKEQERGRDDDSHKQS